LGDSGAGVGPAGDLRYCVGLANSTPGADTVTFDATLFKSAQTITLTAGEILIADSLTVMATSAGCTLNGNNASRVFHINGPGILDVTLVGLTLTGCKGAFQGGAVLSTENLTLQRCVVTGNSASFGGGIGVVAPGLLTVWDSVIANNTATSNSGGLFALAGAVIRGSTISGNAAVTGGGLYATPGLTMIDTTVAGNTASAAAGGIALNNSDAAAVLRLQNCTVSGNAAATAGGGIGLGVFGAFEARLTVQNSTVTNNSAGNAAGGGGIARVYGSGGVMLDSTVVSGNKASASPNVDLFSTGKVSANLSAIGVTAGVASLAADAQTTLMFGAVLNLGPLADNGGPSLTHAPLTGSVLINKGSNPAGLSTDGRGSPRVLGGQADIGAVETAPNFLVANAFNHGPGSLRQSIADANSTSGSQTITFDAAYFATPRIISLTGGELSITEAVTITGPGSALLTVTGHSAGRIVNTAPAPSGSTIAFSGLTLTGGSAATGGAVQAGNESVTFTNCVITGNAATTRGGAIDFSASGTLNLTGCTVSNNTSPQGGGVAMTAGGSILALRTTFTGNSSAGTSSGGGICFGGTIGSGGFVVRNCTFAGNTAGLNGGAVGFNSLAGTATIQNSTIVGNTASTGGAGGAGGGIGVTAGSGTVTLESTVVSGNALAAGAASSAVDLFATNVNAKFSAIGKSTGVSNFTPDATTTSLLGKALLLGPLADNAGPTLTMQPQPGSPLINSGSNPANLTTEQRGSGRVFGGQADIGAVETSPQFVVTNDFNHGAGSLRQAVADANAAAGAQSITFDSAVFSTVRTINLSAGSLDISEAVTITGPSVGVKLNNLVAGNSVLNTGPASSGSAISFANLTISGGSPAGVGGGLLVGNESVTLLNCTVTGNSATRGGGVYVSSSAGRLTLSNCTVSKNTTTVAGAGIAFANGGSLELSSTTLSGNTNTGSAGGGGLYFRGAVGAGGLFVRGSTITTNTSASSGGGIVLGNFTGTLTVQNSTIVGNTASSGLGGGIANTSGGVVDIESCIVSGNTNSGAADISATGTVNLKSSAVGNSTGFTMTDKGGNLAFGLNLKLGSLANNGGPTQTIGFLAGSPCLNAGSNPAGLTTDQRGRPRQGGSAVDIGAFELQPPPTATVQVNGGAGQRSLVTKLTISFTGPQVSFSGGVAAAFQLNRTGPGSPTGSVALTASQAANVVTLTFAAGGTVGIDPGGSLLDGTYQLTILATKVTGDFGQQLDGNANGVPGDNFTTPTSGPGRLHRLFGDNDGDADVDATDFGAFRATFGITSNLAYDFDGDGDVDATDFGQFRSRFGTGLP